MHFQRTERKLCVYMEAQVEAKWEVTLGGQTGLCVAQGNQQQV